MTEQIFRFIAEMIKHYKIRLSATVTVFILVVAFISCPGPDTHYEYINNRYGHSSTNIGNVVFINIYFASFTKLNPYTTIKRCARTEGDGITFGGVHYSFNGAPMYGNYRVRVNDAEATAASTTISLLSGIINSVYMLLTLEDCPYEGPAFTYAFFGKVFETRDFNERLIASRKK